MEGACRFLKSEIRSTMLHNNYLVFKVNWVDKHSKKSYLHGKLSFLIKFTERPPTNLGIFFRSDKLNIYEMTTFDCS